jgi:Protein of unknown function (DUF3987)
MQMQSNFALQQLQTKPETTNYFSEYGEFERNQAPIDLDDIYANMVTKNRSPNGKGNLHFSFLPLTAALCCRHSRPVDAAAIEEIIAEIKQRTMATIDTRHMDWKWETRKLRKMCRDWIEKKPELLEPDVIETPKEAIEPVDLWAQVTAPPLPLGLLPKVIENFAMVQGELMGADPAGLAVAALTVCAAVIPDSIQLQVKQHDPGWLESTRLWAGLVGEVSAIKTPIQREATRTIVRIDMDLMRKYIRAKEHYDILSGEERKQEERPQKRRVRLEDTTPEAAREIMRDSPDGLLLFRDELAGWFGAMDKYGGHRGAAADRGFWLSAYNGDPAVWDRAGPRGSGFAEHAGVSILGGIQPNVMRKLVAEGTDDGLLQRMNMIMLRDGVVGKDEPKSEEAKQYNALVEELHHMTRQIGNVKKLTVPHGRSENK